MQSYKNVEEYIAQAPEEVREKLRKLRQVILQILPDDVVEKISYGMPGYFYQGPVVYFAAAKAHVGLYVPPPIIEDHANKLKKYKTSKSAVQFPNKEDLPMELVKELVLARLTFNRSR